MGQPGAHFLRTYQFSILLVNGIVLFLLGLHSSGYALVREEDLFPVGDIEPVYFSDDEFFNHNFSIPFNFFNETYTDCFVSGNGQISFSNGTGDFTPSCSPSLVPMIMAYWADAVKGGNLYFYETVDRTHLRKVTRDVLVAFPEFYGINLSWMFVVTWKNVPFYGYNASCGGDVKRNTYQLVIATDGTHSFANMYYNRVEWTTGTASDGNQCTGLGGQPAKAGFDFGDGKTLYTIPGSCTGEILKIPQTSNINQPGKWVFRIDSNLRTAACDEFDGTSQKLKLHPFVVPYYGNVPLKVVGPCFNPFAKVHCIYHDLMSAQPSKLAGMVTADRKSAICPMPYFIGVGKTTVTLQVTYPDKDKVEIYTGHIYVVCDRRTGEQMKVDFSSVENDKEEVFLNLKWDPVFFAKEVEYEEQIEGTNGDLHRRRKRSLEEEKVDLVVEAYNGSKWTDKDVIKGSIDNSGSFRGRIKRSIFKESITKDNPKMIMLSLERPSVKNGTSLGKLTADAADVLIKFKKVNGSLIEKIPHFGKNPDLVSNVSISDLVPISGSIPNDTRPCPKTAEKALVDLNFELDIDISWLQLFHPGAVTSVRQKVPSASDAGSQCVYDGVGALMFGPPGGGTLDKYSPNKSPIKHYLEDILPFLGCNELGETETLKDILCKDSYYKGWPSDDGALYRGPRIIRAVGDPHITTFDGLLYTFNPVGEFVMVEFTDSERDLSFEVQARIEQYITPEGQAKPASVFTAAVMKEVRGEEAVQIQVAYSDEKILIFLDGEALDFDDEEGEQLRMQGISTLPHKSAYVTMHSAENVTVSFSSGFSFTFVTIAPNEAAMNIIGMADESVMGLTRGLMGNFDGNPDNDFISPTGVAIPANSSARDIHYEFGLKWIVSEDRSLFTYLPGKSYADYYQPGFEPVFLSISDLESLPEAEREECGGNTECLFDRATTGSKAIASGTLEIKEAYDHIVQVVSQVVKSCPSSGDFLTLKNGFVEMTNILVNGKLHFVCGEGYTLLNDPGHCTCTEVDGEVEPQWICSNSDVNFPLECISQELTCDPPPTPANGLAIGSNYTMGSSVEFRCIDNNYELYWRNCNFNGKRGLCNEVCTVAYTCGAERVTFDNGTSQIIPVWQGYGGDVNHVRCLSKYAGRLATFLRVAEPFLHLTIGGSWGPKSAMTKLYLAGC